MSVVSILGVKILNNPAKFIDPYHFEITFECLEQLQKDLEWKLTYVGSATSSEHDQELDSLLVGPIPTGVNKFIFEADPPDLRRIPSTEILGVTVILLTCSYDDREFVRVGYYVNNEYDSEELNAEPPAKPDIDRVRRNILAEKPRVTRFAIKWDTEDSAPAEFPPEQPEADALDDDGAAYGQEEVELEEGLKAELAQVEAEAQQAETSNGADQDMGGTEEAAANATTSKDAGDDSDVGSEDLEAESSESEDEEGEGDGDEEGEDAGKEAGDADEDMEMDEGEQHKASSKSEQHSNEVMVH